MIEPRDITGLVLAGGQGLRMGGVDKGLQAFCGVPLALHAMHRLQPQVGASAINANRHVAQYEDFGVPVWADLADWAQAQLVGDGASVSHSDAAYDGPLAGFLAGLTHCTTPWLVTVPCDAPRFPRDLVERLAAAVGDADIAMAWAPDRASASERSEGLVLRPQPVFCLMKQSLLPDLRDFLRAGGRKVGAWTQRHRCAPVRFDDRASAAAFGNANTTDELARLESLPTAEDD